MEVEAPLANPSRLPVTDRAASLWGCGDPTELFKGGDRVVLPWRQAPQRKGERLASNVELSALLAGGPHLVDLIPGRSSRPRPGWCALTSSTTCVEHGSGPAAPPPIEIDRPTATRSSRSTISATWSSWAGTTGPRPRP